jgi:CO/xanthine dehydrogenase Mo-binding subunit
VAEAGAGLSRRDLLIRTGWVAGGITILGSCSLPPLPSLRAPDADDAPSWLQVLPDGRIRFYSPKSEMGQGIRTGLAQIVAEELNVDFADIVVVSPDAHQIPPVAVTAGSRSMKSCFEPLSEAGALLRETLRERAALRWGADPASIRDERGGLPRTRRDTNRLFGARRRGGEHHHGRSASRAPPAALRGGSQPEPRVHRSLRATPRS